MAGLATFSGSDLSRFGDAIRAIPRRVRTMEESAKAVTDFLWDELHDDLALVRLYKTHPYAQLPGELQEFAGGLTGGVPSPDVRCLTLLATRGLEPEWNDRRMSEGHKAIPLPNVEFVQRLPMVAGLVEQLGLELADVVQPERKRVLELAQRTYGVFHVEEAAGSPFVPAQEFVERHGVRSALGFGGVLYTGDFFAVVVFARVHVDARTADVVRVLSLATRVALLPFGMRVFD
ncbi:MAG TPA: hypothetical protein VFB25_14010 [Gaiellaceae bacterium]|nr:hypothetical protein [Gaiellaceae bacterium]